MGEEIEVLIDTNVFISGLLGRGSSFLIYKLFLAEKIKLVISPSILKEIKLTLNKPKLKIEKYKRERLLKLLESKSIIVKPTSRIKKCRDKADNMILNCAISGKAKFIITWDPDLLVLSSFKNIPILKPSDFLDLLYTSQ